MLSFIKAIKKVLIQPLTLLSISSIFEVAIAFCIAYLAFDRFRYDSRIQSIIQEYSEMGKTVLMRVSRHQFTDSYFQKIDKLFTENKLEIGPNWWKGLYGYGNTLGYDKKTVTLMTLINISILCIAGLFQLEVPFWEYAILILIPICGIAWPSYLTYFTNNRVRKLRDSIETEYIILKKTYGLDGDENKKDKKTNEIKLTILKDIVVNAEEYLQNEPHRSYLKENFKLIVMDNEFRSLLEKHYVFPIIINDLEFKKIYNDLINN